MSFGNQSESCQSSNLDQNPLEFRHLKQRQKSVEWLLGKPDWSLYSQFLELRKALVWIWITLLITWDINGSKNASVNEPVLNIGFSLAFLQETGNYPEVIERLHKLLLSLARTLAPSFKKRPDRLSKPAALDTLIF